MRHIPVSMSMRSLLYAAETLEQFEGLFQFIETLDNEENNTWREKLSYELDFSDENMGCPYDSKVYSDDSAFEKEYDDDSQTAECEQLSVPKEGSMETAMDNSLWAETTFEIEQDMHIFKAPKAENAHIKDYVEEIAAQHPLLGMALIDGSVQKAIEDAASRAMNYLMDRSRVSNWANLTILLAIIQYAKCWERTEISGFWEYICEQFGYRYSQQAYNAFTNAVKTACKSYKRLFVIEPNGSNSYYATVLAHSLAPSKSFYALCDFLVKFYKNNLDYSVYENDPAISRMVRVLQDRCLGATIEQDEDIRGNVGGIQVGLRALITTRPGYMKYFLTKTLQKMGSLLSGEELPEKDYIDVLLTQWFIERLAESTNRKSVPAHKRTTEIAFTYEKIRIQYILDEDGEPALRVPSIRLSSRENPILVIRSRGEFLYQQTIGIYGNDYAATSEEVCIPLSDIFDADFTRLDVEITIENRQIYCSNSSLNFKALLFRDGKLQTGKTIEEGNYTLFAPRSVGIQFQGNIEKQRRSYFAKLFDIYIQGEASIFAEGALLFCSRPPEGSFRFKLPQTIVEYTLNGIPYPLFSRDQFSITAIGTFDGKQPRITTQTGEKLGIQNREANLCQFSLPNVNGGYSVTLTDENTKKVYDEVRFYIVDSYSVAFDSDYYIESAEDGNVTLDIDGRRFELSLMGCTSKIKVPYGNGDIQILIPRIQMLLDGKPLPAGPIWKGDISPNSVLMVLCPESIEVLLSFADTVIERRSSICGIDFAIGNAIQAYDGTDDSVPVNLVIGRDRIQVFDVVFKISLSERPVFNLIKNTLVWQNYHSFRGEKSTQLKFLFQPKSGKSIVLYSKQGERILSTDFPPESELYYYKVIAQTETTFGTVESILADDTVIFGDKAAVILRDSILCITQVKEGGRITEIKPVYAEIIAYKGKENLGYNDLSGDYAHYTAKLYFMARNEKRYFTDLNPVDIYLVNDTTGILHISFRDGEGLFIEKRGDYNDAVLYKYVDPPSWCKEHFSIPDFSYLIAGRQLMLNPTDLSQAIKNTFADYISTTLSISDERYSELLKAELRRDGVIAKGPYLELGDAYKTGASIRELIAGGVMSPLFEKFGQGFQLSRPLYVHQESAVRASANGDNMVVTTGTGSGKTECYLIPIVNTLLREQESEGHLDDGVRAIVIYPMNALINDQVKRLREIFVDSDITFGVYNGNTEQTEKAGQLKYRTTYGFEPMANECICQSKISPPF